jgi:hypothetical protein
MQLITLYSFVCIHTPSPSGDAVKENESADPSIMLFTQRLYWAISQHSFSATGREKVVNVHFKICTFYYTLALSPPSALEISTNFEVENFEA